jgi:aspartyl protease family protein
MKQLSVKFAVMMKQFGLLIFAAFALRTCFGGDAATVSSVSPDDASAAAARGEQNTDKPRSIGNGYAETVLERSADGHFYADIMINGAPIRALVDTGASMIALSKDDAQRAGLAFSPDEFTGSAQTAGGVAAVKPVMLDRVTLGVLEADRVEAAIVDQGLNQTLLGQSWLKRVGTVTIEGDRMVLR